MAWLASETKHVSAYFLNDPSLSSYLQSTDFSDITLLCSFILNVRLSLSDCALSVRFASSVKFC